MTTRHCGGPYKRSASGPFLFGRPTGEGDTNQPCSPTKASEITWLSRFFSDFRYGPAFIEHAITCMQSVSTFSAMAIRLDGSPAAEGQEPNTQRQEQIRRLAEIIASTCGQVEGVWGGVEFDILGCFLPARDLSHCRRIATRIRSELKQVLPPEGDPLDGAGATASIGMAIYPALTFPRRETITNALKALVHAGFLGPDSAIIFDAVSLNISGDHYYDTGDIDGAIAEYKQALLMDQCNVNVHNSLGVCYGIRQAYDKAQAAFREALALDPEEVMAIYNTGLVYWYQHQHDQALESFLAAHRLCADVFEIALQTGRLLLEMRRAGEALAYLLRATRMQPGAGVAFRLLGDTYVALDRPDEATSAYETAIKRNPNDAASLSALGHLYETLGTNTEVALVYCRQSVAIASDIGLYHHRLGQLYLNRGQLPEALQAFETARGLNHDPGPVIEEIRQRVQRSSDWQNMERV